MNSEDALNIWTNIVNQYKIKYERSENYIETIVQKIKPHSIINNDLILICNEPFIKLNFESNDKEKFYDVMKDMNLKDMKLRVIEDESEVEHLIIAQKENQIETDSPNCYQERYTFDTFVVGSSNRLAHAACVAVAESPGTTYNPLFIYGGVGLGKTHLMYAIANHIKKKYKNYKINYLSSETFTNELIQSIQEKTNSQFREKYRSSDVLLIDDIQFIAGKESTQEEFFHTFNTLHSANKQIIISSDRPPNEIATLEDRIKSRLSMGLPVDIQPPDFETRVAILRKKLELDQKYIPDNVLVLIAKNIKSNIRELEGALTKVTGYAELTGAKITDELAMEALKDLFDANPKKILNADYIKEVIAKEYGIKIDDFTSKRRTRAIAYPRQIAMYLCRELTDMSLPKIGEEFGGRDHTTVLHAYEKISNDIKTDENFKKNIERITTTLTDE